MSKIPSIKQEAEEVKRKNGYYIPPFKMSELIKTAAKVSTVLTSNGPITMSYADCMVVLDIVSSTILKIKGNEDEA